MIFGFEIESEVLQWKTKPRIYPYHKGRFESLVKYEYDGSLFSEKGGETVEIITNKLKNKKDIKNSLLEIRKKVKKIYINKSCGLHMHVSHANVDKQKIPQLLIDKLLHIFITEKIKKSSLKNKKEILKYYYRDYAKPLSTLYDDEKRVSVNYLPKGNNHIEIRSFNAVNCDNFKDLYKIMMIYYITTKKVLKNINKFKLNLAKKEINIPYFYYKEIYTSKLTVTNENIRKKIKTFKREIHIYKKEVKINPWFKSISINIKEREIIYLKVNKMTDAYVRETKYWW